MFDAREWLLREAEVLGLGIDARAWDRVWCLLELWAQYRGALNLTGRRAVEHHVGEALLVCAAARRVGCEAGSWVDVGSGGGFPGLVVAALLDAVVVLVEPRLRRAAFLEMALARLGRSDCAVRRCRLEASGWQPVLWGYGEGRFQVATARAVFEPAVWLARAQACVVPGGHVLAHVRPCDVDPAGSVCLARVDRGDWSARAYSVRPALAKASTADVPRGT
ncbi:MAG: RsmG family class I SAM-dependent methyltransferase [Nannocystaceae bacterium]